MTVTYQNAVVMARGVNALGIMRSLGKQGIKTNLITGTGNDYLLKSRFIDKVEAINASSDQDFLSALTKMATEENSVLLAASDEYVDFLERNQVQLADKYKFILPGEKIASILIDKSAEVKLIKDIGVPVPDTFYDLPELVKSKDESVFPLIIKPRSYHYLEELGEKNKIVESIEELSQFVQKMKDNCSHYIAQNIIPGKDELLWVCNCTYDKNGELLSHFTFNRWRTTPAHYGVTSFAESKCNDTLLEYIKLIGEKLSYHGPAMIEFKYDERDQTFKYIEINPRIGMCNFFDTQCGVNNVFNAYQAALGVRPSPSKQKDKVIYLNLYEDFRTRCSDGEPLLAVMSSYIKVALRFKVGAFWCWWDPLPGIYIFQKNVVRTINKILKVIRVKQ